MATTKNKLIKALADFVTVFYRIHPDHKEFSQVIKDLLFLLNTGPIKNPFFVTELHEKLKKFEEFTKPDNEKFLSMVLRQSGLRQELNSYFSIFASTFDDYSNEEIVVTCQDIIIDVIATVIKFFPSLIESGFYQRYISGGFRPGYDIGEESKIFDGLLIKIYYLNKNLIGILDENFAASDDNNLIKVKEIINFVKCELEDATAHHLNLSYFIKHFNQVDQLSLRYLTEHFKQARQSFQAIIPLYCALSEVTLVVLACALAMEKMPENSAQFLAVLSERLTEIVPMPLPPPQPEKLILKIDEIEIQSFDDLYAQRNKISNSFWAPKNLPIIANLFSSIDEFLKFTPTHRLVKLIKSQPKTLVKLFTRCDDIINFHQKMWTALEETDSVHPDDIWEIGKFLMEQAPLVFQSDTELTSAILYSLKFGSSCQSNFIKAHLDQIVAYFNERDKFIGLIKLNINGELACKLIERLSAVRAELLSLPETILDLIQYSEQLSLLLLRDLDAAAIFDSTEKVLYAFENSKEIPLFLCQTYPGDIISRITSFEIFLKMVHARSEAVQSLIEVNPQFFAKFFTSPVDAVKVLNMTVQTKYITHFLSEAIPDMSRRLAAALAFSKHYFRADLVGSIFKSAIKLNDIELADCIIETSLALENHEALRILQRILMNVDNKIKKTFAEKFKAQLKMVNDYSDPFNYATLKDLLHAVSIVPSLKVLAAKKTASQPNFSENKSGMFFHSVLNVEVAIPDDIQQLLPEVKQDENDVVNENNSAKSKACDDDGEELAQKLMGLLSYSR